MWYLNLNELIMDWIGNNFLAIGVLLIVFHETAKQFNWVWLNKVYLILNGCMKFIRPGSELPNSKPKSKKKDPEEKDEEVSKE